MSKVLRFALLIILLTGCAPATPTPAPPAPQSPPTAIPAPRPDVLYVDPGIDLGPISPLVYGSNHGPWTAVPAPYIEDAYNLPLNIIRFPGGEWGDRNTIQATQVDQFMDFCKRIGATALINVRTMTGTPEEAAKLVRYVNIEKGYGIRYWAIGNEPQFYEAALNKPYGVDHFNSEFRAFAQAMKEVDPGIQIIGPELTFFSQNAEANPKDSQGKDWMLEFLRANGDVVDIVSIHRYPFPTSNEAPPRAVDDLRQDTVNWTLTLRYLRDLIHAETGRDLPIAVTETNSDWSKAAAGEATPDSFYNAIWWADSLGRMIRERVLIVNHWLIAYDRGGWSLVTRNGPSPTYRVYEVYKHFGERLVYSDSGIAEVTIYAARRSDKALTLLIINLGDEAKQIRLEIARSAPTQAEVILLDPQHEAVNLGIQPIPQDGNLSLPPHSVTLYVLKN